MSCRWVAHPGNVDIDLSTVDHNSFKAMAEALAIGMLVGVERFKDRKPEERRAAGMRTFALFALLGALCGLLEQVAFTVVTFAALAVLQCLMARRGKGGRGLL